MNIKNLWIAALSGAVLTTLCNFIFGTLGGWIGGRIFRTGLDTGI
jgi:hypothetical protein